MSLRRALLDSVRSLIGTAYEKPSRRHEQTYFSHNNCVEKIRSGEHSGNTSGFCNGYVQCNLVILACRFGRGFSAVLSEQSQTLPTDCHIRTRRFSLPTLGEDIDIRTDIPSYKVFEHGRVVSEVNDITALWRDDLVVFLLGCSFSFEEALIADGLDVRNISEAVNVPMYKTNIDCTPAGPFAGEMVVSMRPFAPAGRTARRGNL